MNSINNVNNRIGANYNVSNKKVNKQPNHKVDNKFQSILNENLKDKKDFKISAHAKNRIAERNLEMDPSDISKIEATIDKLEEKGARESLLIYKDMALIVSVNNRTVITAMDFEDGMDVVTNIDSAIKIK